MIDSIFLLPFVAGLAIVLMSGPLGCFVVWRRMSMFGDALAHSSILGVALGMAAGVSSSLSAMLVGLLFAMLLVYLERQKRLTADAYINVLAHTMLALGITSAALWNIKGLDLHALLFGDILVVTWSQTIGLMVLAIASCVTLKLISRTMLVMILDEGIASAEGRRTTLVHLIFMFLTAIVTAFSIKLVGVVLFSSFLVIPPASAGLVARSLPAMLGMSMLFGILAVAGGLVMSYHLDLPFGPVIVVVSSALFFMTFLIAGGRKK